MQIKLLTIGNSGVGKTCLLLRYANDSFSPTFITTIGIDFKIKTIEIDGKRIKLQIWDTAGQERFQTILPAYYRGAHGIALCFDVTDEKSFANVSNWIKSIESHASDTVQKILIANKADCTADRVVTAEQAQALATKYDTPLFETSAKNNVNVTAAFEALIANVITRSPPDKPINKLPLQPLPTGSQEKPCAISSCAK